RSGQQQCYSWPKAVANKISVSATIGVVKNPTNSYRNRAFLSKFAWIAANPNSRSPDNGVSQIGKGNGSENAHPPNISTDFSTGCIIGSNFDARRQAHLFSFACTTG